MLKRNMGSRLPVNKNLDRCPEAYIDAIKWYMGVTEKEAFNHYVKLVKDYRYTYLEKIVITYIIYHGF